MSNNQYSIDIAVNIFLLFLTLNLIEHAKVGPTKYFSHTVGSKINGEMKTTQINCLVNEIVKITLGGI